MNGPEAARVDRRALALLGVLSIVTVAGPLIVLLVLRGGERSSGLPDRPIEWGVLIGVSALMVALFVALQLVAYRSLRRMKQEHAAAKAQREAGDAS